MEPTADSLIRFLCQLAMGQVSQKLTLMGRVVGVLHQNLSYLTRLEHKPLNISDSTQIQQLLDPLPLKTDHVWPFFT